MERPTLTQLTYAVAVADQEHFGRAAEVCGVSQPGLSSQIKELERRLDVALFERDQRHVLVTNAGKAVVDHARTILRAVEDLTVEAQRFSGEFIGQVTLGIIPTAAPYFLVDVLGAVRRLHPSAELVFRERQTDTLVEDLRGGAVDIGLLALPFDDVGLEMASIGDDPFHLAMPSGHPLAGEGPLPFGVLAGLPLLLLEDGHCLRDQALEACRIANIDQAARTVQGASLTTLCRLVAAGVGVTLLPESAIPLEASPGSGVVTRPFRNPPPLRQLVLAWRRRSPFAADFERLAGHVSTSMH